MKRKFLSVLLILAVTVSLALPTYAAETKGELEDELSDVKDEKEQVSNQLAETKDRIDELNEKVSVLNGEIAEANSKISQTEAEMQQKQKDMQEREDGLNERLRVMYKNGSIGYVDVLLGSNSISEFLSNLDMIQRIYRNDMEVLKTLQQEAEELEVIKAQLQEEKNDLAAKKTELDEDNKELDELKSELEAREDELLAEAEALTSKIQSMTSPDTEYKGDGAWVWPAPASHYLTSYFGWRMHPVYGTWRYHSGIDIAAGSGTNVLAAAPGTVILSSYYGGYGECIIIDHGGGITSLYGHMSTGSRRVSVGQTVSAGQVIGLVGSTGVSTGPHLHFEVRENGQVVEPLNYVG